MLVMAHQSMLVRILQANGTTVSKTLISLDAYVPIDTWYKYEGQKSESIALTEGQVILLEHGHCNNPSSGASQVGSYVLCLLVSINFSAAHSSPSFCWNAAWCAHRQ